MGKNKEYKKLPGSGARFEGSRLIAGVRKTCTLWLAADHILLVFSTGFNQEFKRFYFRDIQAITVRKTKNAFAWSVVLGGIAAIFGLIAIVVNEPVGLWVLLSFFAFFLTCALVNAAGGQSCITEIKTAVQTEEISSLKRLRSARKTIAILRPLIDEAQGSATAEELQLQANAAFQRAAENHSVISGGTTGGFLQGKPQLKPYSSRVHQWLFLVLLLDAVLTAMHIYFRPMSLLMFEAVVGLSMAGLTITALIKQHDTDLSPGLRRLSWVVGGYVALVFFVAFIQQIIISIDDPSVAENQWTLFERLADLDPFETPWLLWILVCSMASSLLLGMIGLLLTRKFREQKMKAATPPPLNINSSVNL